MTEQVDNTDRVAHWPSNQWHPAYDSLKDWLDGEAPDDTATPTRRPRNAGKHTPAARGHNDR